MIRNALQHFITITKHKWRVMKLCFAIKLYKQGLLHDLSKYSWIEFKTGILYYQGNKSPNGYERKVIGYSNAWLHHKGRNRHHFEYWTDIINGECVPIQMPLKYVLEMFCDRVAANMTYDKKDYSDANPYLYFKRNYDEVIMHQKTKDLLELLLVHLKDHGLSSTIHFINTDVKRLGYDILSKN